MSRDYPEGTTKTYPKPDELTRSIGEVLRDLRVQSRLITQSMGAGFVGLESSVLSRVERGEIPLTIDRLGLFAEAYDLPVSIIIGRAERRMKGRQR